MVMLLSVGSVVVLHSASLTRLLFILQSLRDFPSPAQTSVTCLSLWAAPEKLAKLVHLYEEYIAEEWYEPWDTFNWVAGEL